MNGGRRNSFLVLFRMKNELCKLKVVPNYCTCFFVCFVAILFSLTLLLTYLTTLNSRISITIWSWEQWHLRVVVNNTPRPVSDDSAAVIERQRIQVSFFLMKYGIKKEDYYTIYLFYSYNSTTLYISIFLIIFYVVSYICWCLNLFSFRIRQKECCDLFWWKYTK